MKEYRRHLFVVYDDGRRVNSPTEFYADSDEEAVAKAKETVKRLNEDGLVSARYVIGEMCEYQDLHHNPNGSLEDIAGITDQSGRVFGLMPHPERAIDFTHLPNWTLLRERSDILLTCKRAS